MFGRPEQFPTLKDRYKPEPDWHGKVVPSCIHCHMVREAERRVWRDAGKPMPLDVLFPYPNPSVLGLVMDPKSATRVRSVTAGSAAARAGLRPGDEIRAVERRRVASTADIQSVLHELSDNPRSIQIAIVRGESQTLQGVTLEIADG